ncbi:hypothetical protein XM38_036950 [Halomicronema hongdechloris C2206]|uniref:NB-ARC domain-containing protein n=1 Tax=Halomicronema hongdechloris C2206 TaxID=1641165 RepID=A0A1Z3HRG6_9CYAN|nr:NB-ARC domain-containing protein [Halomicronema hongdechloris]ASC72737.1 hypothetical protein XM38_036950 [Halomicronema hongdechloris C2206]
MPLDRNPCFTGRASILEQIRQALTARGTAGLTQVQAIAGLGGVGKTQTALEYAYRYYWDVNRDEAYQAVFWIRLDTEQALQSGFQEIAEMLMLCEAAVKEADQIVRVVKTWLAEHTGWLLVLDNADDPSFIRNYLPKRGQGHVLITSRVQDLQRLGVIQPLSLDALNPEEAVAFLLQRTGREAASQAAQRAAEALSAELGHCRWPWNRLVLTWSPQVLAFKTISPAIGIAVWTC